MNRIEQIVDLIVEEANDRLDSDDEYLHDKGSPSHFVAKMHGVYMDIAKEMSRILSGALNADT